MPKLCVCFALVLLSHAAFGVRIKRHWIDDQAHGGSGSTGQNVVLEDCLQSCPVTPEYNPVCGSDKLTYDNPGRLKCAQSCGINVSQMRASRCPDENVAPVA